MTNNRRAIAAMRVIHTDDAADFAGADIETDEMFVLVLVIHLTTLWPSIALLVN
jgi:hypothetical protein